LSNHNARARARLGPLTATEPFSGALLDLDGRMGIAGWQWLFILEAAPAVVLGIAFWLYMTDWPSEAHWLTVEQRDWLTSRLNAELSISVEN
jgi:MFS transporter, ACS family, tartrate transporter